DARELNRINRSTYIKRVWVGSRRHGDWQEVKVPYIRNAKPSYCSAYFENGWTQLGTRYVGEEKNGGKWVD
ncbi:TrbM/KikA/MpfK family conjugal transfer protein, partial [Neisseria gonorrhoeae]